MSTENDIYMIQYQRLLYETLALLTLLVFPFLPLFSRWVCGKAKA